MLPRNQVATGLPLLSPPLKFSFSVLVSKKWGVVDIFSFHATLPSCQDMPT